MKSRLLVPFLLTGLLSQLVILSPAVAATTLDVLSDVQKHASDCLTAYDHLSFKFDEQMQLIKHELAKVPTAGKPSFTASQEAQIKEMVGAISATQHKANALDVKGCTPDQLTSLNSFLEAGQEFFKKIFVAVPFMRSQDVQIAVRTQFALDTRLMNQTRALAKHYRDQAKSAGDLIASLKAD